jgi:hypothetical protein
MNILPSLVEGYMYTEMYHLEGGQMSGGYPLHDLTSNARDEMIGGTISGGVSGIQFAHLVVPIGLVCDMRVAPRHIDYSVASHDIDDAEPIDESIHDILFANISGRASSNKGSFKKYGHNPSKKKSLKVKRL